MVRNFAELVCVFDRLFLRELWRWTRQPFAIALGTYEGTEWRFCISCKERMKNRWKMLCRESLLPHQTFHSKVHWRWQNRQEFRSSKLWESRCKWFCSCGQYRAKRWGTQAGLWQFAHWHNSCCKEPPLICMLLVLSHHRQSALAHFAQRGQVRGAKL